MEIQIGPSQNITLLSARLSRLEESYLFRDGAAVRRFLRKHPDLIELLFEAQPYLLKHFGPNSQVALEVFIHPEADGVEQLFASVSTSLPVDEALTRLDKLDEEWFLDQLERVDGLLNFSLEALPPLWQALETAADQGDETAFIRAARRIAWPKRPADDFVRAVHLALAAGAHLLARKLASQGTKLYPDHPELRKMAYILAPPRVIKADLPPTPSLRANQIWLRDHAGKCKGQWVALRDGELLGIADTARELWDCLENTNGVLLTRVV